MSAKLNKNKYVAKILKLIEGLSDDAKEWMIYWFVSIKTVCM